MKIRTLILFGLFNIYFSICAQAGIDDVLENKSESRMELVELKEGEINLPIADEINQETKPFSTNSNPGISDFPSKHPMIVHFPIVLLIVAFFTQLASFFVWKQELSVITLILLAGGAIGAYIASNIAHPHTTGLSEVASEVLILHEDFAAYSKWSSIGALFLKIISHFFLKRKFWGEVIVALVLSVSAYTVVQAGHYGAALTHLHGVGVEGKYLENATHKNEN